MGQFLNSLSWRESKGINIFVSSVFFIRSLNDCFDFIPSKSFKGACRRITKRVSTVEAKNIRGTSAADWVGALVGNQLIELVVSKMFYFHHYLGKMNPIWRAYFSDGLKPTTRTCHVVLSSHQIAKFAEASSPCPIILFTRPQATSSHLNLQLLMGFLKNGPQDISIVLLVGDFYLISIVEITNHRTILFYSTACLIPPLEKETSGCQRHRCNTPSDVRIVARSQTNCLKD